MIQPTQGATKPHSRSFRDHSQVLADNCNPEDGSSGREIASVDRLMSGAMIPDPKIQEASQKFATDMSDESCVATTSKNVATKRSGDDPEEGAGSPAALILPLALSTLILTLCFFFVGGDAAVEIFGLSVLTATVLGKFAVLHGLSGSGLFDSPYRVALLIIYLDLMIGTIAVFNIRVLYRIPKFGKKIEGLQISGVDILERNPWMRKATFAGVVAFVMFPLSGTGAIGGSLFGRLLGMSRVRTLLGIGLGSVLGSFGMAGLAAAFGTQMESLRASGALGYGGVAVVAAALFWLYRRSKKIADGTESEDHTRVE